MASLGSAFPILPGKLEEWTQFCQDMAGSRLNEYEASRKHLGITREVSYLQQTPMGALAVVYIEAEDIPGMLMALGVSQDPFDVWFRERTKEIHGIDFTEPPQAPLPEAIVDWRAS